MSNFYYSLTSNVMDLTPNASVTVTLAVATLTMPEQKADYLGRAKRIKKD